MTFIQIFNLCLLSLDLILLASLFVCLSNAKRKSKSLEEQNESLERLLLDQTKASVRKDIEIQDYMILCSKGLNQLSVELSPFCYQLVAERNDKKFVIKRFYPEDRMDEEEMEFCRREAEELKEIIEKF